MAWRGWLAKRRQVDLTQRLLTIWRRSCQQTIMPLPRQLIAVPKYELYV